MRTLLSICIIGILCFSCQNPQKPVDRFSTVEKEFLAGNFQKMIRMADSLKRISPSDTLLKARLDSLAEISHRIRLDFSLTEPEIRERLQRNTGTFSTEDLLAWEKSNLLEYRNIDGQKRYFNRAASNLKLLLAHKQKPAAVPNTFTPDSSDLFRLGKAQGVLSAGKSGQPVNPVNIRIKYRITVKPDVVPAGEVTRCWMPFPKEGHARQQNVNLIRTFPDIHFIAPDSSGQRSLYLEQKAVEGQPTLFEAELTYRPAAQYFDPEKMKIQPYNKTSLLYQKYTAEERPHIVFTEKIRKLSDSIIGRETDPLKVVRKIYYWINRNIPWAGALEYSTMPDIPGYVLQNRHGDCGMQTLLFMTLARYNGIPVKWQSGWYLFPYEVNLHDWCEVWYEGAGWVPLDQSFGLQPSENRQLREYYITGIDAYRLIVNDATGTPFIPGKKFLRSEPVDFQRGEVEWKGGNLYFDQWNYHMEVSWY